MPYPSLKKHTLGVAVSGLRRMVFRRAFHLVLCLGGFYLRFMAYHFGGILCLVGCGRSRLP